MGIDDRPSGLSNHGEHLLAAPDGEEARPTVAIHPGTGDVPEMILFWEVIWMEINILLDKAAPKLKGLHPSLAESARRLIRRAHGEGIYVIITQGLRSNSEQNALYAQGRTAPGSIVTNARGGYSYHNYGLAFDVCVCDVKAGRLIPNWQVDRRWGRAGAIGRELGLEWGGDWSSFKDYPHFQLAFGLSINQLRNGRKPPMEKKVEKQRYRLMTGTFNSKEEAEQAAARLTKAYGWIVYVKEA